MGGTLRLVFDPDQNAVNTIHRRSNPHEQRYGQPETREKKATQDLDGKESREEG
jgi:hypothetical protein